LRRLAVLVASGAAVISLFLGSCTRGGGEHVFLKMYTSCNMIGSLEPCG